MKDMERIKILFHWWKVRQSVIILLFVSPYITCSSIFTRIQDTVIDINITVLTLPSSDTSTVVVTDTTL